MKKLLIILLYISGILSVAYTQTSNRILINLRGDILAPSELPKADFSRPVEIILDGTPCTNFTVTSTDEHITDLQKNATQSNLFSFKVKSPAPSSVNVVINCAGEIKSLPLKINNASAPVKTTESDDVNTLENDPYIFFYSHYDVGSTFRDLNRYNRKHNTAYFFFDQNGTLLGPAPVNVDADDYIRIYLAVPENDMSNYQIDVQGEYTPSDLTLRLPEKYNPQLNSTDTTKNLPSQLVLLQRTFGPFTSETVTIKIIKKGQELLPLQVPINKLFNVGVGASFVSTKLARPSYEVIPLNGTENTIQAINDGTRTLSTLNVIFYWKPSVDWFLGRLKKNGHITRGRDVLKEPGFWERLNPSFGVELSKNWNENFFVGGNFEFARGGSIIAGWHYGKVRQLVDTDFKLGETPFTGATEDIKLTDTWKWQTFFGVTLDYRIFAGIFKQRP